MNNLKKSPAPAKTEQLIPVIEKDGNNVTNARDLHVFLESKQQFVNWMEKRISEYGFVENEDYEVFNNSIKNPKGGRPTKEYAITIDMAKELAMVEKTEKGKTARRYFIAVEKDWRKKSINIKSLPETASYKNGELFSKKLGETMIIGVYEAGDFYYSLSAILYFLDVVNYSTGVYAKKAGETNAIYIPKTPGAKQMQWFINYNGLRALSVYLTDRGVSSRKLEIVYGDLYRRTQEGNTTTKTRHPYKFTYEQMDELFYQVSKIGRVKLQAAIYEILREGKK